MFNGILNAITNVVFNLKKGARSIKNDTRGAELVQVLIVILIVIIVGGIAVGILRTVAPDLINDTVARIRSVFEL